MNPETLKKTIQGIVRLTDEFYKKGNESVLDLFEKSGYAEHRSDINKESIEKELRKKPEYASSWIRYSEDKRTSSGWYITQQNKIFEIGYCNKNTNSITSIKTFKDKFKACAFFIFFELDDLLER